MADYYELLGVEPDASKDEIRSAYREHLAGADQARRAELNRAWNVLSDPIQRSRYDEARARGEAGEEVEVVSAAGATGARAARTSARPQLEPTVVLPPGMQLAPPRARNLALLFDVSVLLLVFILSQQFVPGLVDSNYSKWTDRYNNQIERVDAANNREDKANERADKARAAARRADRQGDQLEADAQRQKAGQADADAKAAANEADTAQERADQIRSDELRGPGLAATGVTIVLALAYCVPMSALTGQTVGKRSRRIKLVRVDGSPVGWGASLAHYGVPIVLTLALSGYLGPLALVLGFGMVLWYLRDRNRQGLHDKLARTIVVTVPDA